VQGEHLEVLDQDAAVAVHDRFGQAGGARAVEHVQRVVERQRLELQRVVAGQRVPVAPAVQVTDGDHVLDRRQLGADRRHLRRTVDGLVAVPVAVHRDQHLRLDLAPAVGDAAGPEFGRAGREDRPEAGRGQHQHVGLRDVRGIRRDPVARHHTQTFQPGPDAPDLVPQPPGREGLRVTALRVRDDDRIVVGQPGHPQHVLRVVERRPGKPGRARHRVHRQRGDRIGVRDDLEVVPDRAPERSEIGDRPVIELGVIGERQPPLGPQPRQVVADPRGLPHVGRRRPQHSARHALTLTKLQPLPAGRRSQVRSRGS
jgi:hypothetical protein